VVVSGDAGTGGKKRRGSTVECVLDLLKEPLVVRTGGRERVGRKKDSCNSEVIVFKRKDASGLGSRKGAAETNARRMLWK